MLGYWRCHAEFQKSLVDTVTREFKHNPKSIEYFEFAFLKVYCMDLDVIREDLSPYFSSTGRPSNQQPEIFRSLILMSHFKYSNPEKWINFAKSSTMVCNLVGVTPDTFPGESTHRDFISRLWQDDDSDHFRIVHRKPKTKHGKQKLPPKHPGIIKYLADKAISGAVFKHIPERLFQTIFTKTALMPSAKMGLLGDTSKLICSGDGSCVTSNSSSYGIKTCDCKEPCSCPRKFSDSDARWGWDSYHERWFWGHTAYLLSVHNPALKLDLPIYMKFVEASRNDGVTLITAVAHAKYLYEDFMTFDSLLADAAHDHYPIYDLLSKWNIKPFIDINKRGSDKVELKNITLSENGIPICLGNHEMLNWGHDSKRYRTKYRCPMVTGKVKDCPHAQTCNKTKYGKTVYINQAGNLRLLTPVPRNSEEWINTYKQRSAAERVNNRILTDYQLERPKRYGKKKISFFAFLNAINVHLDAQIKFSETSVESLMA